METPNYSEMTTEMLETLKKLRQMLQQLERQITEMELMIKWYGRFDDDLK